LSEEKKQRQELMTEYPIMYIIIKFV